MGNKLDYSKLLLPTKISNSPILEDGASPESFDTEDYLFLPSEEDLGKFDNLSCWKSRVYSTHYFAFNEGRISATADFITSKREWGKPCEAITRTCDEDTCFNTVIEPNGDLFRELISYEDTIWTFAIPPCATIDVYELLKQQQNNPDLVKIDKVVCVDGRTNYHTIELGEFPQTFVHFKDNEYLEELYCKSQLNRTGKKYCGHFDKSSSSFDEYDEYELLGRKYVRVEGHSYNEKSIFHPDPGNNAWYPIREGQPYWCEVEPITWKILNWDEMPTEINPEGTGGSLSKLNTKEMKIWGEKGLLPMPFHKTGLVPNDFLYQNSTPRGYLNGINVEMITENGNPGYGALGGGDFTTGNNFLTQAFGIDPRVLRNEITIEEKNMVNTKKTKGTYGVTVVDSKEKPMPVAEQIEFYINNSIPFMLHGPSGVGKSRRIKDICPDFSSIKLARGMVPENAQGRDVFGFVNGKAESDWAPPAWYKDMCEKAEAKAPEKHILFIDEVTNVDLEQSYLYDIVLERQIAPGIGKFPDNVSVVLAGNEIKDSSVASALAEPLFRRQAHIYLEPNIPDWLEWGSRLKEDGTTNVHPLISDFVASQGMRVFYTPYDNDNPPKHVLDPRGWEQTSDIIYANNGELRLELLANKVGSSIAQNILAFAKQPVITVEDIVSGEIDTSAIPKAYDAKYSMAMRLRNATEEELAPVREFVKKYLGEEMLSVYDATWVGKDKDRAIFLNELKKQQPLADVEEVGDVKKYNLYSKNMLRMKLMPNFVHGYEALGTVDAEDVFMGQYPPGTGKCVHCSEKWQADVLMYVLNKMGKKWSTGEDYMVGNSNWDRYKTETCYTHDGRMGRCKTYQDRVFGVQYLQKEFPEINLSGVVSMNELIEALGKKEEFKIDIDEFWEQDAYRAIHCPDEWQANILMKVFDRIGQKWGSGLSYISMNNWSKYRAATCYTNQNSFMDIPNYLNASPIFSFGEVDLSKYLTEEELKEIQDKMPGTAYDSANVM